MPINPNEKTVLVTGATGRQGGAAARSLVAAGFKVRALVRQPESRAASTLARQGVQVAEGNLNDRASIDRAMEGVYGVYSMQTFGKDVDEVGQGKRVADAAKAANVSHLVYSSGAAVERNVPLPHFQSKWQIECHIRELAIPNTILRPTYFMECLWDKNLFPNVGWGILRNILGNKTRLQMIACDDIGAFVAKSFLDPEHYVGRAIELAGDELNHTEAVAAYKAVFGKEPPHFFAPMLLMRFVAKDVHDMFEWFRESRYVADIPALRKEHPQLRTLRTFFEEKQRGASPKG
jgi:uncharacterized protein YbjT (DUF2867 family)